MKRWSVLFLPLLLAACAGHGGWGGSVQCAPYAREHSGGAVARGRGKLVAAGRRALYPHLHAGAGEVLVFRSTRRLPSGHVSVVRAVKNSRLVLVDHANWEPGRVTRRAPVEDVSPGNNWTQVRVWWTPIHGMGKTVYPAYGFIEPVLEGGSS